MNEPAFKDKTAIVTGSAPGISAADHQKTVPLGRAARPQDIADVVAFFAGAAARHIAGETLLVDGGMHLTMGPASFR